MAEITLDFLAPAKSTEKKKDIHPVHRKQMKAKLATIIISIVHAKEHMKEHNKQREENKDSKRGALSNV